MASAGHVGTERFLTCLIPCTKEGVASMYISYTHDASAGRSVFKLRFYYRMYVYRDGKLIVTSDKPVWVLTECDFYRLLDLWNKQGRGPNETNTTYVYHSIKGDD